MLENLIAVRRRSIAVAVRSCDVVKICGSEVGGVMFVLCGCDVLASRPLRLFSAGSAVCSEGVMVVLCSGRFWVWFGCAWCLLCMGLHLTELCRFSGAKIYPGKGIRFVRGDSQVFLFANSKCKRYFHNRLKPSKLTWTAMYRKQHKKDIAQEAVKKRRRAAKKPYSRSIVGATLEVIQKKRTEKPEVRDAAREAALREIKERIKKTKDEKKAKKAEVAAKSQKSQGKGNVSKGAMPKGPKLGGGGGKR
ncbi:hypothetical protein VNO78_33292 [Psophocarpus tetragonolobus]|uniref:Large ribosomal subunit protein eL24 n=1 Tax=Psophocarpus tetragonolobus TaxID=3891 RepID=A0AAN9P1W7_PSOTE